MHARPASEAEGRQCAQYRHGHQDQRRKGRAQQHIEHDQHHGQDQWYHDHPVPTGGGTGVAGLGIGPADQTAGIDRVHRIAQCVNRCERIVGCGFGVEHHRPLGQTARRRAGRGRGHDTVGACDGALQLVGAVG